MRLMFLLVALLPTVARGAAFDVSTREALLEALKQAKPGSTIRIAAGTYAGGIYVRPIAGTEKQPVVIEGANPKNPPVIEGGAEGIHLTDAAHVTLRHLVVLGQSGNGINIDDGGTYESPSHHVLIENVMFRDIGPRGNHDALKMSGVDDFVVRGCTFEGWAGQAVDLV